MDNDDFDFLAELDALLEQELIEKEFEELFEQEIIEQEFADALDAELDDPDSDYYESDYEFWDGAIDLPSDDGDEEDEY
jgi:hypothetical protein